jgi:small subunit ribosomal protein S1
VINISPKDRKIGLSVKKVEEQDERSNYDEYMNTSKAATSNLGELLKEELEAKAQSTANNNANSDKA